MNFKDTVPRPLRSNVTLNLQSMCTGRFLTVSTRFNKGAEPFDSLQFWRVVGKDEQLCIFKITRFNSERTLICLSMHAEMKYVTVELQLM